MRRRQLARAAERGRWPMLEQLCDVLTDLEFLQARLGVLTREDGPAPATVYDLLRDFLGAREVLRAGHPRRELVEEFYRAIDLNAHVLHIDPRLLLQQLLNARDWAPLGWTDNLEAALGHCPWV